MSSLAFRSGATQNFARAVSGSGGRARLTGTRLWDGTATVSETPLDPDRPDDPAGWVDRHGDGLFRYAIARLRSADLAADVVQETFLEAIRSRATFAGRSSERTWLVGILRHKIADHFRRAERSAQVLEEYAAQSEFTRHGLWRVGPASWSGEPSRRVESREFHEVLARCLSQLPPNLADAFLMRELDQRPAEEVRRELGITAANLWARLHRARSQLRLCLEQHWFHAPPTDTAASRPPSAKGPRRP